MKKFAYSLLCLILMLSLFACGEDPCVHRDADDDLICDNCEEAFDDGEETVVNPCEHRDADDNGLCDVCGEKFEDGKDLPDPPCQHKDVNKDYLCDACGAQLPKPPVVHTVRFSIVSISS